MNTIGLVVSLIAGLMLGVIFYGGLWITVQQLAGTCHPIVVTLGSLLFRMAIALAGLLLAAHGRWQNALVYLGGFVLARIWVARFLVACI